MPGQIQQLYINSTRFGFQDVSIEGETTQQFGSIPFLFTKGVFSEINWEASQESGEVQGNRIQSLGVTDGYGTTKGDFSLLVSESDDWRKQITSAGQYPHMSVFFNFRLTYSVNQGIDVRVVEIVGMKILGIAGANAKGNGEAVEKYNYRAGQVFVNGIALYGDPAV